MKLVIVESPAKCKKIEEFLGEPYKVIASFGHFRELNGLKSIDKDFNLTYFISKEKMKYVDKMEKSIRKAKEVILATDDDREGEAIAWHICDHFNLSINNTKRILFNEITKDAILNAVNNPTTININLVHAQQCRQILDILIGYKYSPMLWKYIASGKSDSSLSAGRCQTPALRIIYDNYLEIQKNKENKVFELSGYFMSKNVYYTSNYEFKNEDDVRLLLQNSSLCQYFFEKEKPKESIKKPPLPFSTSSLQITASNLLKYSPKQTMSLCQKLYEAGLITYMRTDSRKYSNVFIQQIKKHITNNYEDKYVNANIDKLGSSAFQKNKQAQEAHESIRPTNIAKESIGDSFDGKMKTLYKLIWTNTMQSCMADSIYSSLKTKIKGPKHNEDYVYYFNISEKNIFPGWKILSNKLDDNNDYDSLIKLKNEQKINYNKIIAEENIKNVKHHITEAKLVNILEEKNIGRPSTFAQIVDKIQTRDYVVNKNITGKTVKCKKYNLVKKDIIIESLDKTFGNENKKLVIQPKGIMVIEFLIENFDKIFSYNYTESMEFDLDNIAKNLSTLTNICEKNNHEIKQSIKDFEAKNPSKATYEIEENHVFMIGKYGPVIKRTIDGKSDFLKVKQNIELEEIRNGSLSLKDILEEDDGIGKYKDKEIYLKNGKYGKYLNWNEQNFKINSNESIDLEKAIEIITNTTSDILRVIDKYTSIRNGKYGHYIYFKNDKMKKPKFINLKNFKEDYLNCDESIILNFVNQ